ncbi:unnamed protein product [Trifolium pratense]|uniref:Uncharacterized protein n=1 Tax=Trifolium pratense TaxID=57577 RepID=A0ACB0ITZ6_TRIPR|nr:unnamed protein product [Trifolium pratense]
MVWIHESHENYTVKSGYKHYITSKSVDQNFMKEGDWCTSKNQTPTLANMPWLLTNSKTVKGKVCAVLKNEPETVAGSIAMIVWCIWYNRNNWVWNGTRDTAKDVAMRAAHMINEWRTKHELSSGVTRYNAATLAEASRRVVEVEPGTNNCMHKLTAAEGEAMAILEVMRIAISRGWTNIVFESDSKVVVDAIHVTTQGVSELSSIISSIKLLLQCNMNFEIKFTKRQASMAAHTLAKAVISWSSRTYFNGVPRWIKPFIINEMS